ncbi:MAG: hypothetical protein ABI855_12380, partial [Bacteroidota bacterium]
GKVTDKGAVITFPNYGVEGYAPYRHLIKENGSAAKQDETLEFKVLEFSKDQKRILVSHTRINEDKLSNKKSAERGEKGKEESETDKKLKKMKDSMEKSTLGDLGVLSGLKSDMETSEKNANEVAERTDSADSTITEEKKPKRASKKKVKAAEGETENKSEPVETPSEEVIAPENAAGENVEVENKVSDSGSDETPKDSSES